MKKNLTELVFILDKSGSMSGLEDDTIGGFNSMIEKQKTAYGEAYVSTVLFSNDSEVVHDRVSLDKIKPMTRNDYVPSGCTALMDAIGDAVKHISNIHKYARKEDIPERTIFVITTDGMENASHRYDSDTIKSMIEEKKEADNWEFLFLGANIDAVETARKYGISEDRAVKFKCDSKGTKVTYGAVSEALCCMRAPSAAPMNSEWKSDIEADLKARENTESVAKSNVPVAPKKRGIFGRFAR